VVLVRYHLAVDAALLYVFHLMIDCFDEHLLGCNDVLFLFREKRDLTLQIIADLNKFENVENFNCVDGNGKHIGVH
jgi:hypothetical protein